MEYNDVVQTPAAELKQKKKYTDDRKEGWFVW
jgi:hypothetical protein